MKLNTLGEYQQDFYHVKLNEKEIILFLELL